MESRGDVRIDVVDGARRGDPGRAFLQRVATLAGAGGIALLVPVAILLVGLPIALVARGIAEAVGWLFTRIAG